ncbi:hypothetical protein QGN29_09085 [Temperatibacter marinus]|uniref:Uncharacterized protein n=1 Tax=Temperatibacter marinus TaxID=1456591 RepID=A0AA52EFR0_9PROT|nr:hypothetical protein [Temperatibacter marinus]WND01707.1 hypothetical protein QGN29_09085 [Temperatibacter marinus]
MANIRQAMKSEMQEIQNFLHQYWRKNFILARDNDLFEWQHHTINSDLLNFIIARDPQNDLIGILGFIPSTQYSSQSERVTLWLTTWKVKPTAPSLTGMQMLQYIAKIIPHSSIGGVGMSLDVAPLYKALKYEIGTLNHWYIFAHPNQASIYPIDNNTVNSLKEDHEIHTKSFIELTQDTLGDSQVFNENNSYKNAVYLINRYLKHPTYTYQIWQLEHNNHAGLIVTRKIKTEKFTVMRIIDFVGDALSLLAAPVYLRPMMQKNDISYVDFYEYGLPADILNQAGFSLKDRGADRIIPDHFEPFEYKNIDIHFIFKSHEKIDTPYCLFKGDGDQDRPS